MKTKGLYQLTCHLSANQYGSTVWGSTLTIFKKETNDDPKEMAIRVLHGHTPLTGKDLIEIFSLDADDTIWMDINGQMGRGSGGEAIAGLNLILLD